LSRNIGNKITTTRCTAAQKSAVFKYGIVHILCTRSENFVIR
jgi:hypothetical protein